MSRVEVIILAGGRGSRLKSVVDNIPKPMASIRGKPFLEYLLKHVSKFNVRKIVFCLSYKHEAVSRHFGNRYADIEICYSIADKPLGTGGAAKKGLCQCSDKHVVLINGDTFYNINLDDFFSFHVLHNSDITMSLKPMKQFSRYGSVEVDGHRVTNFREKQFQDYGLINGGWYVIGSEVFSKHDMQGFFSFERDLLENRSIALNIYAKIFKENFIDIGVPEDFKMAQECLPRWCQEF